MKAVHIIAAVLFMGAIALACAGQSKGAIGLCALSTLIELIGSAMTGKGKNI